MNRAAAAVAAVMEEWIFCEKNASAAVMEEWIFFCEINASDVSFSEDGKRERLDGQLLLLRIPRAAEWPVRDAWKAWEAGIDDRAMATREADFMVSISLFCDDFDWVRQFSIYSDTGK